MGKQRRKRKKEIIWNLFFCIVTLTYEGNKSQFKPWKVREIWY